MAVLGASSLQIDSATLGSQSGSAPMYACRAWVQFNGTGTVAVQGSGNVSSTITDNGTGDYTVNFTTGMPDGNYSVVGSAGGNFDGSMFYLRRSANYGLNTGSVRVFTNSGNNSINDMTFVCVAIFR